MAKIIDFDLYKDSHLIVESEPVAGLPSVIKWIITGERQSVVDRSSNALMSAAGVTSSSFSFPGRIDDKNDPRYKWYRTIGYTSESPDIDALKLQLKEQTP